MRVVLQERRECFVISDTKKEWHWTTSYAQLLCQKLPIFMRMFNLLRAPTITSHAPPGSLQHQSEGENSSDEGNGRLVEDRETGGDLGTFEDDEGTLPPP